MTDSSEILALALRQAEEIRDALKAALQCIEAPSAALVNMHQRLTASGFPSPTPELWLRDPGSNVERLAIRASEIADRVRLALAISTASVIGNA